MFLHSLFFEFLYRLERGNFLFIFVNIGKVGKMTLSTAEDESDQEIHIPADIDWEMLDKSKFFFLGAALFSGVSATLYPVVVLKNQATSCPISGFVREDSFWDRQA